MSTTARRFIKRIRSDGYARGDHLTERDVFVLDVRAADIPNTIRGMLLALPANCVGVSLRVDGGRTMRRWAERVARQRGLRIFWLGPRVPTSPGFDVELNAIAKELYNLYPRVDLTGRKLDWDHAHPADRWLASRQAWVALSVLHDLRS